MGKDIPVRTTAKSEQGSRAGVARGGLRGRGSVRGAGIRGRGSLRGRPFIRGGAGLRGGQFGSNPVKERLARLRFVLSLGKIVNNSEK